MLEAQVLTNPFPGLRSFQPDENHLFFGREDQIDNLLRRLRDRRFLAVVGTSGSGKSSLVRAGLLPALYSGYMAQAGSQWRVAIMRPGNNPIAELAKALNHVDVFGSDSEDAPIQTIITETVLRRGALGLVEAVQQARMSEGENLLIVVDQFEELFRFKRNPLIENSADQAAAFVKLLLEAIRQEALPIYIVLTMRSDFLGDCAQFRDLPDALNDSQYLIPRLTRDQLRMAIESPIKVGSGEISPRLVGRLLNDVGDNPDQLPILQHALMRTWDYWIQHRERGESIDVQHYEAIGSMSKALSNHADEIYQALSTQQQRFAEILFRCLTEKGQDGRGIRRLVTLEEAYAVVAGICEEDASLEAVKSVIEEFRATGRSFLMPPENEPLTEASVLDISHESLIRVWERLRAWVDREAESARTYLRLVDRALQFNQGEIDSPMKGIELKKASDWLTREKVNATWAKRYSSEFETMMEFVTRSEQSAYVEDAVTVETRSSTQEAEIIRKFDTTKARVFLCYTRTDREAAQQLHQALEELGRDTWMDCNDIAIAADWWQSIEKGIESCDTFVVLLSPQALSSRAWLQEISYAVRQNKKIIPVVVHDVNANNVPPALSRLNWLFLRTEDHFASAFAELIIAIDADLEDERINTRLLQSAIEWDQNGREESFLLRGFVLLEAQQWLDRQTEGNQASKISPLQQEYLQISHAHEKSLQLREDAVTLQHTISAQSKDSYEYRLKADFERMIDQLDVEQSGKDYLKFRWLEQVLWMENRSHRMRDRHRRWKIVTIVCSAVLPIVLLLNFNDDKIVDQRIRVGAVVLSLVVTTGISLEEFNQYSKRWDSYRKTAELLRTQGWQFFQLSGVYRSYGSHHYALPAFMDQIEAIVQRDVEVYVTEGMQPSEQLPPE